LIRNLSKHGFQKFLSSLFPGKSQIIIEADLTLQALKLKEVSLICLMKKGKKVNILRGIKS
jgi:hypothetical protein